MSSSKTPETNVFLKDVIGKGLSGNGNRPETSSMTRQTHVFLKELKDCRSSKMMCTRGQKIFLLDDVIDEILSGRLDINVLL